MRPPLAEVSGSCVLAAALCGGLIGGMQAAVGPPAEQPTPAAATGNQPPSAPTVALIPEGGLPPDSVSLEQPFRIEVRVPAAQASAQSLDVTLATTDGVDREPVVVPLVGAADGVAIYRTDPISIGGTRGDWRVTVLPFGVGQVSLGGFTTPGTITGLDLGNGDSITATVSTPAGGTGTSIQVFDSPIDQGLSRAYLAMYSWQEALRIESQLLTAGLQSGAFTPDQVPVVNGILNINIFLKSWLDNANERVAKDDRPYAQLAILTNYLRKVGDVYEHGFSLGDPVSEQAALDGGIDKQIESWASNLPADAYAGAGLAFYNGVTAIPFTGSGYTAATSLFQSYETGTFSTGQTAYGTEATTWQWVWAWVDIAGQATLMRMYSNPGRGLTPFRDPRSKVKPLVGPDLTLVNPIERNIWNQAARLAERFAKQGATAEELVSLHQQTYKQLGDLAHKVGLPHATRALDAMNDATRKGHAIDLGAILENTRAPRMLPPISLPGPSPAPPAVSPFSGPVVGWSGPPVGWPSVPAAAPVAGPAIPGGVVILDPLLLAQNKIAHRGGLSGVPETLLAGTPAEQSLMRQAVLNPAQVRIREWNVNFGPEGGETLRRLTKDEWAWICSGGARRAGPGTTQAGSIPFFGALGQCYRQQQEVQTDAPPDGAVIDPAVLDAAAERIEWFGCDFPPAPGSGLDDSGMPDCRSWTWPAPSGDPQWTSFGYYPPSGTWLFGDGPPEPRIEGGLDGWSIRDRHSLLDGFLDDRQVSGINGAATADEDQFMALVLALWRSSGLGSQSPRSPFTQDLASGDVRPTGAPPRLLLAAGALLRPPRIPNAGLSPTPHDLWVPAATRQAARTSSPGAQTGFKVFFTSLGRSSGEAMQMTIVNEGPLPLRLQLHLLALRPLARLTDKHVALELQKLAHLPQVTVAAHAYCLNFAKRSPRAGMVYALADAQTQARMVPVHRIVDVVRRLRHSNAVTPDSDAQEYFESLIQWSIWTVEQRFDERGYGRAFVEHARKNVAAAGRRWTPEIEKAVSALVPGRWSAIQHVLREGLVPVPR